KELPTTKLRVYEDRRRRSFRAKVLAVEGEAVVLDQMFFYPEGGGQEADHGTIDEFEVYDVQRTGPSVLHFVRGDASRLQGKRVACTIDANRREALMRNHTATHIVLGAARKVLGNHIWQAGAHKAADMARLDITHFVARTSDVALIKLLRSTRIQDGVVRLEYAAGKGAFDVVRKQSEEVKRAAEIFGVPADQLVSTTERVVSEWKELRKLSQRTTDEH